MLNISQLTATLGGRQLYRGITLQINPGEKVGLVGTNGAGKSSLFRFIIKEINPDKGEISFTSGKHFTYFSQKVGEMHGTTALQEVTNGNQVINDLAKIIKDCETKLIDPNITDDQMNKVLEKMGQAQTDFERLGGYDIESRAEEILTGLGIMPEDHQKKIEDFNGGHKMRIALAKTMVTNPDLILMDEPTNYLDMETILWLEEWLINFKGAVFFTTHDRTFMNNIAKKIVEISNGEVHQYSGNYNFYLREREVRHQQIRAEYKRQQDMLAKEEEFIAKFKARASHAAQVQSRVKKLEKIDRIELPPVEVSIDFEFPKPPRGGDSVASIENLGKSWQNSKGEDKLIFKNLSVDILRSQKIAVVGVNGAGKSTLLKVIAGKADCSHGSVQIGPSINIGYFGQYSFESLHEDLTVLEQVMQFNPNHSDNYFRNLLAAFLFRGDDVDKLVKHLSGGERSRLIIAGLLTQNNNFLILDEPTNHLDIKSREILLQALKDYEGTILFVSHDRHFLDELAKTVFEVSKQEVHLYPGNYRDYLQKVRVL